jgi:hypothetical protein
VKEALATTCNDLHMQILKLSSERNTAVNENDKLIEEKEYLAEKIVSLMEITPRRGI